MSRWLIINLIVAECYNIDKKTILPQGGQVISFPKGGGLIPDGERDRERGPRINNRIGVTPIRLIGAEGEQLGVMPTAKALAMADDANLDLVEVSPAERPPVCKLMDYGKYRYEQSRKARGSHSGQPKVKEIRIRPNTGDHDLKVRVQQAMRFLQQGDKILLKVVFRGRELIHIEEGQRVAADMMKQLLSYGNVEKQPSLDGKCLIAILSPK